MQFSDSMKIEIREVKTKADAEQFAKIPFEIYKGNRFWVPPLTAGEIKALFPKTNPAFDFCKANFFLAYKNNKCAGRIGCIINEEYNKKTNENLARLTRLEFFNDEQVSAALLLAAEQWAKENGMSGIHGPLGFTNLDSQGVLVEGFDHLPSVASVYHHPYYHQHLEKAGYSKEIDWIEFRLTIGKNAVEKANRGASLIQRRYGIEVMHFKKMKELLPFSQKIFEILNDAFSELSFVVPFSQKMMDFYREKYIRLLNPEFVKIVSIKPTPTPSHQEGKLTPSLMGRVASPTESFWRGEGLPIGFIIGLPSLSEAMQKAKGKLFPFGFLHILRARRGKEVMDQTLTGVKKDFQATGAAVVLMSEIQKVMLGKGMKYIETTGIFETNHNAIANWKNYEHIQHKRKRCYRKMF